jgi:hypothetical protein
MLSLSGLRSSQSALIVRAVITRLAASESVAFNSAPVAAEIGDSQHANTVIAKAGNRIEMSCALTGQLSVSTLVVVKHVLALAICFAGSAMVLNRQTGCLQTLSRTRRHEFLMSPNALGSRPRFEHKPIQRSPVWAAFPILATYMRVGLLALADVFAG